MAQEAFIMETIVVTVKGVKVFADEKSASVQLTIDKAIKGFAYDRDAKGNPIEGALHEADVNTISFHRSKLTAQLCDASDDIAMYRATLDHSFGQKEFGVILFNAKLKINRDRKAAGEVVGEGDAAYAVERDCYITDVVGVTLSDRAISKIDDAVAL